MLYGVITLVMAPKTHAILSLAALIAGIFVLNDYLKNRK